MGGCCGFGDGGGAGVPTWQNPINITHTELQAAALTNSVIKYTLPPAGIIHGVKLKHSVTFLGGAITEYNLSVGFLGLLQALLIEYNVLGTAVAADNFALAGTFDSRNHSANTSVYVAARSVGANLNASTQGLAQLWILVSRAL